MEEKPKVCILDCYFEQLDDEGSYYKISDEELSKFIVSVRAMEDEIRLIKNRHNYLMKIDAEKLKHYYTMQHVYKVELGKCRRKLTRIYKHIFTFAMPLWTLGKIDRTPSELVKMLKGL